MSDATTTEGRESYLPNHGRSETEPDCETSAYLGTYGDERTASESTYLNANETNGTNESPPAMRRISQSPACVNDGYDGPSSDAALCVLDL